MANELEAVNSANVEETKKGFLKKMFSKKDKKGGGKKKTWLIVSGVILALLLVFFLFGKKGQKPKNQYSEAKAEKGTVSKNVIGTGSLTYGDTVNIKMPSSVEVEKVLVSSGDVVKKGEALAKVNIDDAKIRLAEVKTELSSVDRQLNRTSNSLESETIKSTYSGRVKKVYAQKGKKVTDVILENGSIMVISTDGKMAVNIESQTELAKDSTVQVKTGSTTLTGKVLSASGNNYTITVSDKSVGIDEKVDVVKDGNTVGSGKLYIHSPIEVSASGGTISSVHVKENDSVSVGTKLITVSGAKENTEYLKLKKQREELIEEYNTLALMAQSGELVSNADGTVKTVGISADDETSSSTASSSSSAYSSSAYSSSQTTSSALLSQSANQSSTSESTMTTAFVIATDSQMKLEVDIDEMDILSIKKDMAVTVTLDAVDNKSYEAKINKISNSESSGSSSGTSMSASGVSSSAGYVAEILLDKDENMRSGMSATATIVIEKKENVVTIPVNAVQEVGGRVFVYTAMDGDSPSGEVDITTGLSDGKNVEITSGLSEGQTVYYKGISNSFEDMFQIDEGPGNERGGERGGGPQGGPRG